MRVNQQLVAEPGTEVAAEATLEIKARSPFASRGGEKLIKALRERTNLRHLQPDQLYGEGEARADLGVADLSFISLTKILGR